MRSSLLMALAFGVGCATARPSPPVTVEAHAQRASEAAPSEALPFIHDDYAGALKQAQARGVPLFVDVWAPW